MREELNRTMWKLTDDSAGRTYASIPTDLPETWERRGVSDEEGGFQYVSGEYVIEREKYGKRWEFFVTRQTVRIGLFSYARLRDAERAAMTNARGQETRHFA